MKLRYTLFLLAAVLLLVLPAQAKGPANRIVLTGPNLETPIFLTEPEIIGRLSFGSFEDFLAGAVDEPADPGDYFELERQFELENDKFQTFDKVRFYPDPGLIHYLGIVNGWTEYDDRWYPARPEAAVAFRTLFDSNAHPYLVLMQDNGSIHFVEPMTLEEVAQVELFDFPLSHLSVVDGPDTQTLYFSGKLGTLLQHYRLELGKGTVCQVDTAPSPATSEMLWLVGQMAADLSSSEQGTWLEPINMISDGQVLLHHPLGRYHIYDYGAEDRGEIPGGILVYSQINNRQVGHWQQDKGFAQVIAGNGYLYAIQAARGGHEVELYTLDGRTGEIVTSRSLTDNIWHLGYAILDLRGMANWSKLNWPNTCQLSEWEVSQMFRFTAHMLDSDA